jgi:recombination protein RecA
VNDDKTKRLQLTLWDIQKRWGEQSISLLNTLGQADASTVIRTGISPFDTLLGEGGIPRGKITEVLGVPTSGMTTLAHKISAHAQSAQSASAYIDLNGTFDPDYALRCGVTLERLLIVRPKSLTQALEIARDLFREGKLNLVVLDLLSDRATGKPRDFASVLRRLHEPLAKSATAVLFLLPLPSTNTRICDC